MFASVEEVSFLLARPVSDGLAEPNPRSSTILVDELHAGFLKRRANG
jgi:hypothetical protein